jgi:Flp pilus assembly pilin Flp
VPAAAPGSTAVQGADEIMGTAENRFCRREDATASEIENALLVGLIAVAIVAAVTASGTKVARTFTSITGNLPS